MKELKEDWQEVRLGDIVKYYNNKISHNLVTKYNYVSTENLLPNIGGKIKASSIPDTDRLNSYLKNHILISNIRPYFKKIWFAKSDGGCSSDILVFESSNNIYPKYLYYIMCQNIFFDYIMSGANGTKMPRGDKKHILNFNFLLPPLEEQKKIASILSSLDDKIELNNRMNKILEETAQTIFKEWFINFNFPNEEGKPYKNSGGKMIESELGEIPEGWEVTNLDNLLSKFTTGLNPRQNFKLGEGNNYYVTIKNMNDNQIYLDNRCDKINDDAIIKINKRSDLKKNDLLFSGIGTIGRVYLINKDVTNWNISESIFTMRVNDIITPEYLYLNLLDNRMQEYALNLASGSVQKGIRMGDLKKYKMIIPKKEILILSTKIFSSIIEKVNNNFDENRKLAGIRDSILPKLMSGEIRIK